MPTINNSSMISEAQYDEPTKVLTLKFTKGGWYGYLDVPKDIYEALITTDSVGKYFLTNIKGKYETEKY